MKSNMIINKTMDYNDLCSSDARTIIDELNALIEVLNANKLKISSWYGMFDLKVERDSSDWLNRGYDYKALDVSIDDNRFPWFLYWEIVWIVMNAGFKTNHSILDLGGSSSLFSYYLAHKGYKVKTVDLNPELVANANLVSKKMSWDMKNYEMDMRYMNFNEKFDHITAVCVYEHLPMYDRVVINKNIRELLYDGGKFSITFDYKNPSKDARISTPQDIFQQFVEPSGLKVRGNEEYYDNGICYLIHPFYHENAGWSIKKDYIIQKSFPIWKLFKTKASNDYTFGALFLEKVT